MFPRGAEFLTIGVEASKGATPAPRLSDGSSGVTGGRLDTRTLALMQGLKELAMAGISLV